jgi:hypothetical protein
LVVVLEEVYPFLVGVPLVVVRDPLKLFRHPLVIVLEEVHPLVVYPLVVVLEEVHPLVVVRPSERLVLWFLYLLAYLVFLPFYLRGLKPD